MLAFHARQDAVRQRDIAVSAGLVSQSEALGDADPRISRLLSVAAWRLNPSSDARYAMLTAAALPGTGVLTGDTHPILSLAFSRDGKTLASGFGNGTVQLRDMATGGSIGQPLTGPAGPVYSVAFSPDGKTLAGGGADRTIRIWHVAYLRDTAAYLCASAGPPRTRAEWARWVPSGPAYQDICPVPPPGKG